MSEEIRNNKTWKQPSRGFFIVATFFIFHFSFCILAKQAQAQTVVDKMVATVNGGVKVDLITYSDILWQLALQPETPLVSPRSEDLNIALRLLINQRLILQEADKLPAIAPTDEEVKARRDELVRMFPSQAEFQQRMASVGLSSEQLTEIVRQRVTMEKYLDFRFRSFTVITQKEVTDHYNEVWVPRFRRQHPGRLVDELKDVYADVESELTEAKIESETDAFLDDARERAEVTILSPL